MRTPDDGGTDGPAGTRPGAWSGGDGPPGDGCDALYREAWPVLLRYLVSLDRDLAGGDAEDLAQEVFVVVWRKWPEVRDHGTPIGFVLRTAHLLWQNHRRSLLRRRTDPLTDPLTDRTGWAAADPVDLEAAIDLWNALPRLPLRQRQVLLLRLQVGLPVAETAWVLGIAEGTVTRTTSDALGALRRLLDPEGDHDG